MTRTRVFDSFEEFEKEYLPERHSLRSVSPDWLAEQLASDLAEVSLKGVERVLGECKAGS